MLQVVQLSSSSVLIRWKCILEISKVVAFRAKYKQWHENPVWQEGELLKSLNSSLVLKNLTVGASYYVQIVIFLSNEINMESRVYPFDVKRLFQSSPTSSSYRKYETAMVAGSITAGLILILFVAVSFYRIQKMRKRNRNTPQQTYPSALEDDIESRTQPSSSHSVHNDILLVDLPTTSKKRPMTCSQDLQYLLSRVCNNCRT